MTLIAMAVLAGGVQNAHSISPSGNLASVNITTSSIRWIWTDNSSNETGYRVHSTTGGSVSGNLPNNTTFYDHANLTPNTSYSVFIETYRNFGNSSESEFSSALSAVTLANPPSDLSVLSVTSQTVNLSWTAASSASYRLDRSQDSLDWTSVTTTSVESSGFTDSGLSSLTTYYYRCSAINTAGIANHQFFSNLVSTRTNSSFTGPQVAIIFPATGALVSGSITISGTAFDAQGLSLVEVSVDGGSFISAAGLANWTHNLDTLTLSNGAHTVTARVTNTSSNTQTASISINVQNDDPTPQAPLNFSGTQVSLTSVKWTWLDNSSIEDGFTVSGSTGGAVSSQLPVDTTFWIETEISIPTICRSVAAFNVQGSSFSGIACLTLDFLKPKKPEGVTGTTISSSAFKISWSTVTTNEDDSPATDVIGYRIYKVPDDPTALVNAATSSVLAFVSSSTLTFTDFLESSDQVYYYTIRAVDTFGNESENSKIIDTTGLVTIVSEDGGAVATIPNSLAEKVNITISAKPSDVGGKVLSSYDVKGLSSDGRNLTEIGMSIVIKFLTVSDSASSPFRSPNLASNKNTGQMSAFYFNGVNYMKLGGQQDGKFFKVTINRYGTYQIRSAFRAGNFNLLSVEPTKIFTPNGDCINDFYTVRFDNPTDSNISSTIYDIQGREVASMLPLDANSDSCLTTPSDSTLTWNGKDKQGDLVDSGVYIYQIKSSEGGRITGTMVIAK